MKSIVGEPEVLEETAAWHDLKAAVSELQTLQATDGSVESGHAAPPSSSMRSARRSRRSPSSFPTMPPT